MNDVIKNFLVDSDDTGKHIVYSQRTGKKYFVEPFGSTRMADWGSYNPSTGNIENKKGTGKFSGCVNESESVITEKNGFINIEVIDGGSPYSIIDKMDAKYPTI
jgi:hypothetical protein